MPNDTLTRAMSDQPSPFDPKAFLKTLTTLPGAYRMLDAKGQVLYVGKARNLKKRVSSYFRGNPNSVKVRSLVAQVRAVERSPSPIPKGRP